MSKIEKLAAIDIGSNAVRLLINAVFLENGLIKQKKVSLVRVPIRLGEDVFTSGKISEEKIKLLSKTIKAFRFLMQVHGVTRFKAVATSAMREASNASKIINQISIKNNIIIDVITGKREALIIANVFLNSGINLSNSYLYVDVGGGSTELNIISEKKIIKSKSFKIGTVRYINDNISDNEWKKYKDWIFNEANKFKNIVIIASGGNAGKILKIANKKTYEEISKDDLINIRSYVKSLSYEDRLFKLQLNEDRADVIIPAMTIYLEAMKYSSSETFIVPRIGLADGVISQIYNRKNYGQKLN
tara:strand:+ start:1736 stop:2641 length:906 start_codon:yes stop_codon:yes gene_type:complete